MMNEFIDNSALTPDQDGRYAVVYRQGGYVRRWIADYSVEDGWLIGMAGVEILAWCDLPKIPNWIIKEYSR